MYNPVYNIVAFTLDKVIFKNMETMHTKSVHTSYILEIFVIVMYGEKN